MSLPLATVTTILCWQTQQYQPPHWTKKLTAYMFTLCVKVVHVMNGVQLKSTVILILQIFSPSPYLPGRSNGALWRGFCIDFEPLKSILKYNRDGSSSVIVPNGMSLMIFRKGIQWQLMLSIGLLHRIWLVVEWTRTWSLIPLRVFWLRGFQNSDGVGFSQIKGVI